MPLPHFRQLHTEAASSTGGNPSGGDSIDRGTAGCSCGATPSSCGHAGSSVDRSNNPNSDYGSCCEVSHHDCCRPGSEGVTGSPDRGRERRRSSGGSERHLTVADHLVTDPLAEGCPALRFSGVVNAKDGLVAAAAEKKPPWSGTSHGPEAQYGRPSELAGPQPPQSASAAPAGTSGPHSEKTESIRQESHQLPTAAAACKVPDTTQPVDRMGVSQVDRLSDRLPDRAQASNVYLPHSKQSKQSIPPSITASNSAMHTLSDRLSDRDPGADRDTWTSYWVPNAELAARGAVLSIVGPDSPTTECFTKTYSSYSKVCANIASCHKKTMEPLALPTAPPTALSIAPSIGLPTTLPIAIPIALSSALQLFFQFFL